VTGPSAFPIKINHHESENIVTAPKIPAVSPVERIDILFYFTTF
jgi:hypothetical protein